MTEEQNELVISHMELAKIKAKVCHRKMKLSEIGAITYDDLYQAGIEGLMQAATRFDPSKGIKFKTFCSYRIVGAIKDLIRSFVPIHDKLIKKEGEAPVTFVRLNRKGLVNKLDDRTLFHRGGIEEPIQETPLDFTFTRDRNRLVEKAIKTLDIHQQELIYGHFYKNMLNKEIAKKENVSEAWVGQMLQVALKSLRRSLASVNQDYS